MEPCCYEADQFLCKQGESGDRLFIIQSGVVEIHIESTHAPMVLDQLRSGDILGEMALITGEDRAANAVATTPIETLELDRDAFATIISGHPNVLLNISHILIQRQKKTNSALLQMRKHGEAVAIGIGSHASSMVTEAITLIRKQYPGDVTVLDLIGTLDMDKMILEKKIQRLY